MWRHIDRKKESGTERRRNTTVVLSYTATCWLKYTPTQSHSNKHTHTNKKKSWFKLWGWMFRNGEIRHSIKKESMQFSGYTNRIQPVHMLLGKGGRNEDQLGSPVSPLSPVFSLHAFGELESFCPTMMLLYIFCCSSLYESFTFCLFRPPSLYE